jgi:hypothetical protein
MPVPDQESSQSVGESVARTIRSVQAQFMEHPRKERMSYCVHAMKTLRMSFWMAKGSVALAIHAVFPFWFEKTGENAAKQVDDEVLKQLLRLEAMKSN